MSEWKDISTAPMDSTMIVGVWWYKGLWAARTMYWNGLDWECPFTDNYFEPVYWMPLPPPPKTGDGT